MEGQMLPEERKFLYNAVINCKPKLVLEIGTWKGGGSTFQIASAIHENNNDGRLYTCELDKDLYDSAVNNFLMSPLNKIINFYNIPSTELIHKLIESNNMKDFDFIFFDGPEDPQLNLDDFKLLDNHILPGTYFCMHDWDLGLRVDGLISTKAKLLRPYLEQSQKWKIIDSLTYPISVGLVLAMKVS